MGRKEKMSPERKEFIQQFLAQNDIRSAHDIEIALRDMMKETLQTMLENELTEQLGYDKYEYGSDEKIITEMDILKKQFILLMEILS